MARDGADRAEGFAGQSVAGSPGHPGLSSPGHAEAGDGSPSHRSLTGGTSPRSARSGVAGKDEASGTEPADPPFGGR